MCIVYLLPLLWPTDILHPYLLGLLYYMSLYALCLLVTVNFIASTSNLGLLKRDLQSDLLVAELPTGNCQY